MDFIKSQLTRIPPVSPVNLATATVLITGANTGLGLETAREILKSSPKRLILAVRNAEKGDAAKSELSGSGGAAKTEIVVKKLDQSSFESVTSFARGLEGERVDIAILNAGVMSSKFSTTPDGYESDIQVNTLSPALLSLLLLPNLRLAAKSVRPPGAPQPHLTFVSSGLHVQAKFSERKLTPGEIFPALNNEKKYSQSDRYPTSKLINLFWTRELATRVPSSEIVVNAVNPGFSKTGLMSQTTGLMYYASKFAQSLLGREAEDGARCIVDAAIVKGSETHGRYLSETVIKPESPLTNGSQGQELQKSLWDETVALLSKYGLDSKSIP